MKLEDYLEEVRSFAGGEFLSALFAGRRLEEAKQKEIAARIAAYTGLDEEDVLMANLRVPYVDFCGCGFLREDPQGPEAGDRAHRRALHRAGDGR